MVHIPEVLRDLLEEISFQARESEFVDSKSGVSARLSISALENLYSSVERRLILNGEKSGTARVSDFWGIIPAITGKIELVYEGEQEGPYNVAMALFSAALKEVFLQYFPNPEELKRKSEKDPYGVVRAWFSGGNAIEILNATTEKKFKKDLEGVAGLKKLAEDTKCEPSEVYSFMDLALHSMAEYQIVNKEIVDKGFNFNDLLGDLNL